MAMNQPPLPSPAHVVNATRESFDGDVRERSQQVPVVVDFWAEWCGPCRLLGPLLERLAGEYAGRFELVKADTDRLPEAALQFRVESIPAVFGLVGGEVVDGFQGALPEPQVRAWLDRLVLRGQLAAAQRLEPADAAQAESMYRALLEHLPHETAATIGLARVALAQGRRDEAQAMIQTLERRGFLELEAEKVKALLELSGGSAADLAACRAAVAAQPDALPLQLELAEALARAQQYQTALDLCLSLVERDRRGVGEAARRVMVDVFRVLPSDSELVTTYRRKLSAALY